MQSGTLGILAPIGVGNLRYRPAGRGARTRTGQGKLRDVVNVKDFGALGNGAADDAAAFNAAIAVVDTQSTGGGIVYIPAGIFMLGSEISVPAGVRLVGEGQGTIIRPLATVTALFNITGGLAGVMGCELGNVSSRATSGIRCTKGANNLPIEISGNLIASFPNGISWSAGDRPYFHSNTFISNTTCILLTEDGRAGWIRNNYMLGGNGLSFAFTTQQCEGCFITNNQIYPTSAANIGVYFEGGLHNVIESNIIDITGAGGHAIYLAGNAKAIAHIKIKNNWCAGGSGGGAGLRSIGNVIGLSSSGNTYTSNATTTAIGILADDLQRGEFIGDVTFALTGKAYQFTNCDFISVRDCKFQNGAQGTEDSASTIIWSGSEGIPTTRSAGSIYDFNWADAVGRDLGYNVGVGGTVTQITSKATGVTLNKRCGQIVMATGSVPAFGATGNAIFQMTNNQIVRSGNFQDNFNVRVVSSPTANAWTASVVAIGNGSVNIMLENKTAGAINETGIVLGFEVVRGAIA